MEFSLFAHMERQAPEQDHQHLYEDFLTLCSMADQGGMRAIWTGEHHGMEFTIAPNPFITITDLARHTKNVRLGTGTTQLSQTGLQSGKDLCVLLCFRWSFRACGEGGAGDGVEPGSEPHRWCRGLDKSGRTTGDKLTTAPQEK